jgi:hypothetical protein
MVKHKNLLADKRFIADLAGDDSAIKIAAKWGVGSTFVKQRRREVRAGGTFTPAVVVPVGEMVGRADIGPDGGEFVDVQSDSVITDWDSVFRRFNLDPDVFEIVNDTVRMSTWQQSKALEDGSRDVVNLYSYRAQFRRKTVDALTEADIAEAQKRVRGWKLPRRTPGTGIGVPVAAVVNLADIQAMKPDGDGLEGTLTRLYDGLENVGSWVERMRKCGRNIDEIVLVNNGDPFEGIGGNYANQAHTVQGGLRAQMNVVLDVWESYSRELYPRFDKGQFVTVHCNHTQFGRQGGAAKSLTGDEDTGSAFLAEALQRVLRGREEFDHVEFTIPDDEMNVYATIAGVPVGFNHGHKIPGTDAKGFESWLNGQVRGDNQAHAARIWITAHKHHFATWDMGSCTVFQCPSCDGGSKWLRDTTGRYSRAGILAMLVGEHEPLGWSDVAFL